MTFEIIKRAIEVQKKKGTLDANSMMNKLDVFLLNGRIDEEQYNEIAKMMMEEN